MQKLFDLYPQGQTESKKNGKATNSGRPETKGTAMSFGFKKKLLYSTAGSKKAEAKERERIQLAAEGATNNRSADTSSGSSNASSAGGPNHNQSDDNGNTAASIETLNESRESTGRSTPRLTPPRKESTGAPYRSIRFGFRQANVVRPASTGLNPTVATYENVSNNNG